MKAKMTSDVFCSDGRIIRMGETITATPQKKGYLITTADGRKAKGVSSVKFIAL